MSDDHYAREIIWRHDEPIRPVLDKLPEFAERRPSDASYCARAEIGYGAAADRDAFTLATGPGTIGAMSIAVGATLEPDLAAADSTKLRLMAEGRLVEFIQQVSVVVATAVNGEG